MQLYLDSFGAYLFVRNGMFAVRTRSAGERLFAVRQVGAILMTAGVSMSTDAALLAAENDIPLLLIDADTHSPLAMLGSGKAVSIAAIRRNQAIFSRSEKGLNWAAELIAQKTERQIAVLQTLAESASPEYHDALPPVIKGMERQIQSIRRAAAEGDFIFAIAAERLRGKEGTASRLYFRQLSRYLSPRLDFHGRQGRPAYDPFNALLNYLYGMLYTSVHLAALKTGLDPYMAVLHADRYGGAPTLSFDLIEPFRPWADAVALQLTRGWTTQTGEQWFRSDPDERGLWLSKDGKGAVIDGMLQFLKTTDPVQGRQVKRSVQIDMEAQKLAAFLKGYLPTT